MNRPLNRGPTAFRLFAVGILAIVPVFAGGAFAQERKTFRIAWSIDAGWMPCAHGDVSGIGDHWADRT